MNPWRWIVRTRCVRPVTCVCVCLFGDGWGRKEIWAPNWLELTIGSLIVQQNLYLSLYIFSTRIPRVNLCLHSSHSPMNPTAIQTKHRPKAHRRPLWILHPAFAALVIARYGLDHSLVGGSHLHHFVLLLVWLFKLLIERCAGSGVGLNWRRPWLRVEVCCLRSGWYL